MMKSKLKIAVSPLTNTIYAGKLLKNGTWAKGKQDVTIECLCAVAQHINCFGKPVELTDPETGKLICTLTVNFE